MHTTQGQANQAILSRLYKFQETHRARETSWWGEGREEHKNTALFRSCATCHR